MQTGQKCDSNFCILNIVARNGLKKYRKIVTYVDGENLLREKHERIVSLLKQECSDSIFAKAYIEHSSIVKNAKAHMYNDIFLFFDVKDFFPSISHNYLIQ